MVLPVTSSLNHLSSFSAHPTTPLHPTTAPSLTTSSLTTSSLTATDLISTRHSPSSTLKPGFHSPSVGTSLLSYRRLSQKASHAQQSTLQDVINNEKYTANVNFDAMFMNIPVRSSRRAQSQGHALSQHHQNGFPEIQEKRRSGHVRSHAQRHKGIPPAVAALLAVTTIPPPQVTIHNGKKRKNHPLDIYIVPPTPIDGDPNSATLDAILASQDCGEDSGLIFDTFSAEESTSISRSTSVTALETLLSPPSEFDDCCSLSIRSASSDSVPSLDDSDAASISSDEPSPPKPKADRKLKIRTTTPEDCLLDHPLLFKSESETDLPSTIPEATDMRPEDTVKQPFRPVLSFKSNLTASLRALKSAAKSFSAFSNPIIQPDDFLTRKILSNRVPFTDEKRPKPTKEIPTPALRRYLNPTSGNKDSQQTHCTGAIQMQTYNRTGAARPKPPPRQKSPQQRQVVYRNDDADSQRPREIRENGDFLRVIVLEMNMRRGGKLSETAQGRARVFLPPRKTCRKARMVGDLAGRWEILTVNPPTETTVDA